MLAVFSSRKLFHPLTGAIFDIKSDQAAFRVKEQIKLTPNCCTDKLNNTKK